MYFERRVVYLVCRRRRSRLPPRHFVPFSWHCRLEPVSETSAQYGTKLGTWLVDVGLESWRKSSYTSSHSFQPSRNGPRKHRKYSITTLANQLNSLTLHSRIYQVFHRKALCHRLVCIDGHFVFGNLPSCPP